MNRKIVLLCISIFVIAGFVGNVSAFAGAKEIKQRMIDRKPQIDELKKQGAIGEDNKGFLAFVGQKNAGKEIVDGENADRLAVYQAIAKQTGSTAEAVGQRRAVQIAKTADPGDWLQDANGKWYQK